MTDQRILQIERLGQRGEGIAQEVGHPIYVPYALAGETVRADVDGERGDLLEIIVPSPDRIAPYCPHYTICGGCAVQTLTPLAYAQWKRGLVETALRYARVEVQLGALVDAHGEGRRRATFHVRYGRGTVHVGFMKARAHDIVDLDACPVLAPSMKAAIPAARAIATALQASAKPLDILVTATRTGFDIDIRGHGSLAEQEFAALTSVAQAHDFARLSNHGLLVLERRMPVVKIGLADLVLPPGAFLQATDEGEAVLAQTVTAAFGSVRRGLDLFAGVGTFSLRLAERTSIHAVDSDEAALAALARASREQPKLRPVSTECRDLFRRPLTGAELALYDGVVFDPPRAGAEAQARALAQSSLPLVVAVSCNPAMFGRDLAILCAGGYGVESVTPFDQFRSSPHVEMIAILRRSSKKARPKRRLLS
ncbi:MAG: RNA methyltransferase [Methylovirgula sp.]|jgi:23S rRNA (uracil1939-C5)-methyltransferase